MLEQTLFCKLPRGHNVRISIASMLLSVCIHMTQGLLRLVQSTICSITATDLGHKLSQGMSHCATVQNMPVS